MTESTFLLPIIGRWCFFKYKIESIICGWAKVHKEANAVYFVDSQKNLQRSLHKTHRLKELLEEDRNEKSRVNNN